MLPNPQGLYHPENEHDNCGAGFICSLKGKRTNDIIHKALDILVKLEHRGAVSACLLYTSPSPRDPSISRMPSSA